MTKINSLRFCLILSISLAAFSAGAKEASKKSNAEIERKKKAYQQKRMAEEKEVKALFKYTFDDIASQIVIVSCSGTRGRSSGSGFIATMDGKTYLFTNQHVIMGADKISLKTTEGVTLRPRKVELSKTRDIARLLLEGHEGLAITKQMKSGAPVGVFGNSEGGGVATELYGKIKSIGADTVEVSADFVSGNSGSPVLNLNREVLGIASYVRFSTDEDADGSKTRRFCYRLTDNQWKPVNWKNYNNKYGDMYRDSEKLIESIFEIINTWYSNPSNRIQSKTIPVAGLDRWKRNHNQMVNKIDRMLDKGRATQKELDSVNRRIRNDLISSAEALSQICASRSRQMDLLSEQRELTGFLKDEFKNYSERMKYVSEAIDDFRNELNDYNYFHFE